MSLGSVDVDAQDFAQERVEVLSVADLGPLAIIVAISSVAHTDIEKTLGSKGHPTPVVIAVRLVDLQAKDLRRRINSERLSWGCGELRDAQGAIPVGRGGRPAGSGVRDEHPMVLLELGVQDEVQHSALIEGPVVERTEPGREGEDRAFAQLSGLIQESDETRLIDDQRLSIRQGHIGQRRCQAASNPGERNLGAAWRLTAPKRARARARQCEDMVEW